MTFTVAQANALVPYLTAQFQKTRRLADELKGLRGKTRGPGARRSTAMFVGERMQSTASSDVLEKLEVTEKEIKRIVEETTSLGIEVRRVDGLADFPCWYEGNLVYLCWRYGESEIRYFHAQSSGFDGRRTLPSGANPAETN